MPEQHETIADATETGEKMIPVSAVAPLLGWFCQAISQNVPLCPVAVAAYDIAAREAGWPLSTEIVQQRLQDLASCAMASPSVSWKALGELLQAGVFPKV